MASASCLVSCCVPGAQLIEPATQGDYDGLCGLYCIINAIRLVMAPHKELVREEERALFTAGVRFLELQGCLPEALHSCVGKQLWPRLAECVVTTAQQISEHPILLERPRLSTAASIHEILRSIEAMIALGKAPCVFFRGRYRHYSVISGHTPVSLKLFDSFGHHWIWRRSCGTTATPAARHRFDVRSIIALSAFEQGSAVLEGW